MAVFATIQFDFHLNLATIAIMPVPVEQDDTQTDSESLENGSKYTHTKFIDDLISYNARDEITYSPPLLDEDNTNDILTAASHFLEKLTDDEANVRCSKL